MRIAFFGGSFDPPHRGHLAIARAAMTRLGLDQVWMAPVGAQPLKPNGPSSSYADRLAMVELATAAEPNIAASSLDAPRADGRPNYTIDVLRSVRETLPGTDVLFLLLGADAFLSVPQWHGAEELPFLCEVIVAGRPGFLIAEVKSALPSGISAEREGDAGDGGEVVRWKLRDRGGRQSRLYLMPDLREDVSATDIRAALAGEESAAGVLTPAVLRYIDEGGLYR